MLDFAALKAKTVTLDELIGGLTRADLAQLTNEMVDEMQRLIKGCTDDDVVFTPVDPLADDKFASSSDELHVAWTLGHVIVHTTASAEESASLAAELARGVEFHGRSRYEVPWPAVTTIEQCRHRLEESRRMRLASLDMWPDAPHLENTYEPWLGANPMNAMARFVSGLRHDWSHLGQIGEIVRQVHAARAILA
jgi:hypothetical protein